MPGKRRDNILMLNLFVLLDSPEMAAQSRFLCIFYFAICIPMCWLSGKTHELKGFTFGSPPEEQWFTPLMVRFLDTIHEKLGEIISFPSLFLSQLRLLPILSIN